jgi:hypothetical protein
MDNNDKKADKKPNCPLIGADGNIFNLMAIARRTLKKAGHSEQADELYERVTGSGSYYEALTIIGDYVNFVEAESGSEM